MTKKTSKRRKSVRRNSRKLRRNGLKVVWISGTEAQILLNGKEIDVWTWKYPPNRTQVEKDARWDFRHKLGAA